MPSQESRNLVNDSSVTTPIINGSDSSFDGHMLGAASTNQPEKRSTQPKPAKGKQRRA